MHDSRVMLGKARLTQLIRLVGSKGVFAFLRGLGR